MANENTNIDPASRGGWHLDKRVPLVMIFTIAVQTLAAVWFIANLSFQVNSLIAGSVANDRRIGNLEQSVHQQDRQDVMLAEQMRGTKDELGRIRTDIQRTNVLLEQLLTGNK